MEPMPGDELEVSDLSLPKQASERVDDSNFEAYVNGYAERMKPLFDARRRNVSAEEIESTLSRLALELQRKLERMVLADRVSVPLYVSLSERPELWLRVDFAKRRVEPVNRIVDEKRYTFVAGTANLARVLDGFLTWEDFLLSMRMRLSRAPDDYDALLHSFLAVEADDLPAICEDVLQTEARQERMVVKAGARSFSIHRFCPHQGADLSEAWVEDERYLVCPRHRWRFNLENGGRCTMNACSVHAEKEQEKDAGIEAPPAGLTLTRARRRACGRAQYLRTAPAAASAAARRSSASVTTCTCVADRGRPCTARVEEQRRQRGRLHAEGHDAGQRRREAREARSQPRRIQRDRPAAARALPAAGAICVSTPGIRAWIRSSASASPSATSTAVDAEAAARHVLREDHARPEDLAAMGDVEAHGGVVSESPPRRFLPSRESPVRAALGAKPLRERVHQRAPDAPAPRLPGWTTTCTTWATSP